MTEIEYPVFLSKIAKGVDKVEGGSQKNLAKVISQVIREDKLEKKVIGLEGEWGSGKSNLIKIIQSQLGENYHTFIFDSWGSQEDLTRKSFLEQLIDELFLKEFLTKKEKWKDLKNRLLSNTSTTHTQKYPQIKSYWLILSLAIISFTFLSSSYENVLKDYDLLKDIDFGVWKPILWIYIIPLGLSIWGFCLSRIEYKKEREKNAKKKEIDKDSKWVTLGKMFYWFNGSEINSEEVQNIIEDEPSVKQFREYFKNIEEEIINKGKLILVFDNLDRLENDKIKALWSSIHTFFAEDKYTFDSWVIIPYDKSKLEAHLDKGYNGFISKTFSVNFRITPPVVTQWEAFLNQSLEDAFGKKLIENDEKEYVIKLFDILSSHETIKPRQIINYINNLVSMYKEWQDDIINKNIKFRYISLFVLTKDKILENPNNSILNRSYLGNSEVLFVDDEDLDTSISMITFGVKNELADEVLLDRQLKSALREGNENIIKSSLKHRAFEKYFFQANKITPLNEKHNGLVKIYNIIKDVFSDNMMKKFWDDFGKELIFVEGQFYELNDNHKAILINTNKNIGKNILNELIRNLKINFNTNDVQNKYFSQLLEIEKFIKDKNLDINFLTLISKVNFNPESYLNFVAEAKNDFNRYKITCSENELLESFFGEGNVLNIDKISIRLNELNTIKSEFKMEKITDDITSKIATVTYNDMLNFTKYIQILKTLKERPLNLKLSATFYAQLSTARLDEDVIYEDAYCIAISDFQIAHDNSGNFQNSLRSLTDEQIIKVSSKIEAYFNYGSLLKLLTTNITTNSFPNLKKIAYDITINSYGTPSLDIDFDWVLKEFDNISLKVYENDVERIKNFIKRISAWHMYYKTKIDLISEGFFKHLNNQDLKLIELITKDSLIYFNNLSKEEIIESFKSNNKVFKITEALIENNLIDKFSDAFYSSYDDYMKGIAEEEENIPEPDFWDELIDKLDGRKLISTYTSIRDILINGGEVNENLLYFFEKGLVDYGNLQKKPESSTLKIVIPMIESDKNFDLFLDNHDKLLDVINISNEHKETAIGELQLRYNSEKYRKEIKMLEVAKKLNLELDSDKLNEKKD